MALPKPMWGAGEKMWAVVVPWGLCCTSCGDTGMVTLWSLETGAM